MSFFIFIAIIVIIIGLGAYGNIKQVELTRIRHKADTEKKKDEVKQEIQQEIPKVPEDVIVVTKKPRKITGRKKKS
jgi:hypothetical protein